MLKFLQKLLLIAALCVPWATRAQSDTLVVADGTATNTYVPIYGYYCDEDQHNQVLYPASMLSAMAPCVINSMWFHQSSVASDSWGTTVTVRLVETSATSLTDLVAVTNATTVWSGIVNGTTTPVTFNFTTPFVYNGGNLLVDITVSSVGDYSQNYWYGVSSGSSVWTYGDGFFPSSLSSSDDGDVETFTPKTTFIYSPASDICFPPTSFTASVTGSDVDFSWVDNAGSDWQIVWGTNGFNPDTVAVNIAYPTSNTFSLTNLADGQYTAYIRTDCGTDTSVWVSTNFNVGVTIMNMATSGTNTLTTCNAIIYDDGGPNGQYSNSCQSTLIIQPATAGDWVSISGSSYTESTYDYLTIYDGTGTTGEMLWTDNGIDALTNFGPFASETITVVFHSDGSVMRDGFQINVSCIPGPSCVRPASFAVTDVASDSAYLEWVDTVGTEWLVAYGPAGFTLGSANTNYISTTDNFIAIGDLTPNTDYDFYLMTLCGTNVGDTSLSRMLSLRTACVALDTLPYIYGFEGATTGGSSTSSPFAADCWLRLNNGTSYGGYPYISSTSTYCHTGSRGLYWYNTTTTGTYGDYQCLVLPGVNTDNNPINTLQLKFWAKSSSSSTNPEFQIGVMTNPNDINSFTTVSTVTVNGTNWTEYDAFLSAYQGTGRYVAIRALRASWTAYVDDFTLDLLPECPHVASISIDSTTSDYLGISWIPSGDESEWLVYLNDSIIGSTSDTTYEITDLDINTLYAISVAALCDNGDTSEVLTVNGRTLAGDPIAAFPYFCGFEIDLDNDVNEAADWVLENGTQANYWMVGSSTNNGGSRAMYITNNGTSNGYNTSSTSYVFAYATFQFDAGEYVYSYDWKAYGESSFDFIRAAVVPNTVEFTAGSYCGFDNASAMPAGGIAIDGAYRLNLQSSWQTQTGTFTIATPGVYKMVFMWRNDGSGGTTPPAAIDNINVLRNTCPAPVDFVAAYASTDSLVLSWHPLGDETSWSITSGNDYVVTTDTFYVFDNLTTNTGYTFTLRALCGSDDSSMVVSLSARTTCGAITVLPYIEDFDTYPGSTATSPVPEGFQPACWDFYNDGTRTNYMYSPYVYNSSTYAHSGSNSIRFYSYNSSGDSNQYLILPIVDTSLFQVNQLQLSFWLRGNSTSSNYRADVVVGVMNDINDESSFVPYDTVLCNSTTYARYEVIFSQYTGYNGRIALLFPKPLTSSSYEYGYLDDLTLELIPDCPAVSNVTQVGSDQSSLTLTWTENGSATSWNIEYGPHGFTLGTGSTDVAIAVPHTIANLSANTEYDIYITPVCGSGVAGTTLASFRTDCGELTVLPYFENFEGLPVGASANLDCGIPCWGRLDNATTYHFGYIGNPSSWSTGGHSGTGFVYYYMPTTTGTYADWIITILPPVDTMIYPINTLQLSFWVKMNSTTTTGDIQIGVISDVTDPTTFVPVDTVSVAGNVYDMKTAYLSSFVGSGNRVAMKYFRDPSTATYYFVDDVTLEPMPDCPPVSNISLAGLDSNYLSVTWTENGNATSWNVEYGLHGFTPGTGTSATVTSLPFTINGLATSTEYDVYVTPECTSGTAATQMETFRTASSSASLPFFCGFEGAGTNNWDFFQAGQDNYWVVGNAVSNGGSKSLYVTDDGSTNSYSGTASYSFATRTFNLQPGNYICSYDWKCNGEGNYDFIRAALVPASVNIVAGGYCGFDNASAMPAGSIALDGGYRQNLQTSWQTQVTEFTLSGEGSYNLVFLWRNDGSVYNLPPAAIDNVSLMLNTCPMPTNITASNLTQTSVDFTWTEPGSASQWEYQLDNGTPIATTSNNCSLTGLTANTPYAFRVRSICGAGDTSFWAVYNFRTPCVYMTLPYEQDFETEPTGSSTTGSAFVNCWTRLNNGTSYGGYPYVSSTSTYNHTAGGTKGLYWYNTTTMGTYGDYQGFVLAPVDPSVGIDSLQLSFWAKASSASYTNDFQIGVMTDPNNVSTFVGIDTVTVSGTNWTLIEVPFTGYTGSGLFIAVKSDRASSAYMCIDDLLLDYIPTCLVPQNVHASEAGVTSISVDWTDVSAASEWEIEYAAQGSTTTTSIFVTSHPYTFSSLDSMTTYTFRVRAVCTAGDTSHWSVAANLSTVMCDNATTVTNFDATMNASTSSYSPIGYSTYNYSYTQTIIDSAQLAGLADAGDITAMGFSPASTTAGAYFTNMTVYLANLPDSLGDLSSSFILPSADLPFVKVVDNADFSYTTTGMQLHEFDTIFTWDGTSRILVSVVRNHGAWTSGSSFDAHIQTSGKMRYIYNDNAPYDYTTVTGGTASTTVGDIYLISCGAGCAKPANLAATNVTYNSATLNWSSNATDFEVSWKANTEATWTTPVAVTGANSYAVTGLVPETAYQFMVRAICDTTEGISSDWVIGNFTTADLPCFVPTDLQADPNYTDATFSWTADASQTNWTLHIWNSAFDQEYDVTANPYTATGLTQNTTYNAAIKAVCGGGAAESEYGDTISFTTSTCAVVTGVVANATSATTATVTWNATEATSYEVNYGPRGFQTGDGEFVTVTTASANLTGLNPQSNYDVYVRALCGTGVQSNWSEAAQFSTPAGDGISTAEGTSLSIYPNPTTSATTIALSGVNGEVTITIVDMNGRVVMSDSMSCEGDCTKTMEVSGLAQGAYFVRISGESTNMVKKLVVK